MHMTDRGLTCWLRRRRSMYRHGRCGLLDGLVQLAVLDRNLTAPPGEPADVTRYIVASGATGDWAGWDESVAYRVDGAWMRLLPRPGLASVGRGRGPALSIGPRPFAEPCRQGDAQRS